HQVQHAVVGATEIEDADAVGVVEGARGARLGVEARDGVPIAEQVAVHDLDGDHAAERALFGAIHSTHAPYPDELLHDVGIRDYATYEGIDYVGLAQAVLHMNEPGF